VPNAAENRVDPSKRRSTRIVQAVPILVTGVDALGRPFQERTSSLAINCHGGRYQSKHYVLKNMWVTLEVPHTDSSQPPRRVRGRVTWIQRPRTVRELFQVAVELETPGNIWGIAFPPPDWIPFPENVEPQVSPEAVPGEPEFAAQREEISEQIEPPDNLRVFPAPGGDPAVTLARQMARLVGEARQQVQAAVREATTRSVSEETRPLLAAVESQLREAAQRSVQDAVTVEKDRLTEQALERLRQSGYDLLQSVREQWQRESERHVAAAGDAFLARVENLEQTRVSAFEQQLEGRLRASLAQLQERSDEISAATGRVETFLGRLKQELDQSAEAAGRRIQALAETKAKETSARVAELEQAAERVKVAVAAATTAAHKAWTARLDADRTAAAASLHESVERSIEGAAERTAKRLSQQGEAALRQMDQELALRLSAQRQLFADVATQAQGSLATLRESLDKETARRQEVFAQIQQATERMEKLGERLQDISQATLAELERRSEAILAAGSAELERRSKAAVAGIAERLQPAIEFSGQETLSRLATQLEERLTPQVERARELVESLSAGTTAAEITLREREQHARETLDLATLQSIAHLQETSGRVERDLEEAGRKVSDRWVAELESKATETTHTTFEALLKASSWYEKKVQTQMQATLDKGTELAESQLRQKAGEISGLFATELDHYSRSYVEHTQGQMAEAITDAVQKLNENLGTAAGGAAADFQKEIRQSAQKVYEEFGGSLHEALQLFGTRADTLSGQARAKIDADAARALAEFQKTLGQEAQLGVAQAKSSLEAHLAPLQQIWKDQREAQEQQFTEKISTLSESSLENYRQRLENTSNSFLVTAVAGLTHQSQGVIENLAQTSEERLRNVASQVFSGIGETLRQRLLDLSASFSAPPPPENLSR
jgi:hypothetical protein